MSFNFGTPAAAAAKPSPFNFGAPAAPSSTAPSTGSLFGNPSQPTSNTPTQQTPSLFGGGGGGGTSTAPSLFSGFGAQQPPTSTAPATSSSLFGGAPKPSLFGGFGATASPQQQQQQQQPTATPTPTPTPTPTLFGQSQSAASQSLFGPPKPPPSQSQQPTSLFGGGGGTSSTSSSFLPFPSHSTSSSQPHLAQSTTPLPSLSSPSSSSPSNPNEDPTSLETLITDIATSWDPTHPNCRFQTFLYNYPAPGVLGGVEAYRQGPPGVGEEVWRKAVRENPDPEHLVPALAVGFPALQRRLDSQLRQSLAHQSRLMEITSHLSGLSQTHSLTTSLRTLRAVQKASGLTERLGRLVARSSGLTLSGGGSSSGMGSGGGGGMEGRNGGVIKREEEELRVGLEGLKGRVEAEERRVRELWSGVGSLKARKLASSATGAGGGGGGGEVEYTVVDEEGMRKVLEIIAAQQAGLDLLTRTLNQAQATVQVVQKGFGVSPSSSTTTTTGTGGSGNSAMRL